MNSCGVTLQCGNCASGWSCNANVCTPPASSNNPGNREGESGTLTGGFSETGGAILNAANGSICWSGVNMGGNTQLTVHYGNGEPVGDRLKVTFNGTQIGAAIPVNTSGNWSTYITGQTTFPAQSGSGTLCVAVDAYSAWVAKIDKVTFN